MDEEIKKSKYKYDPVAKTITGSARYAVKMLEEVYRDMPEMDSPLKNTQNLRIFPSEPIVKFFPDRQPVDIAVMRKVREQLMQPIELEEQQIEAKMDRLFRPFVKNRQRLYKSLN